MSKWLKFLALPTITLLAVGAGCGSPAVPSDAQTTPEKVVETFYQAMMAGDDNAALAVVPDDVEATDDFQDTWQEVSTWTYNAVTVGTYADGFVEVEFDVTVEGDQDSGTDQVEVKQIDGKWWVTDVPR
ncbi:MAG: hypothetical protein HY565_06030 [Candidatus Kerfeldbacteria bacterium]|nr:hypothetical protein [Candidatus Kerfeldbacteria bacterium]